MGASIIKTVIKGDCHLFSYVIFLQNTGKENSNEFVIS